MNKDFYKIATDGEIRVNLEGFPGKPVDSIVISRVSKTRGITHLISLPLKSEDIEDIIQLLENKRG